MASKKFFLLEHVGLPRLLDLTQEPDTAEELECPELLELGHGVVAAQEAVRAVVHVIVACAQAVIRAVNSRASGLSVCRTLTRSTRSTRTEAM